FSSGPVAAGRNRTVVRRSGASNASRRRQRKRGAADCLGIDSTHRRRRRGRSLFTALAIWAPGAFCARRQRVFASASRGAGARRTRASVRGGWRREHARQGTPASEVQRPWASRRRARFLPAGIRRAGPPDARRSGDDGFSIRAVLGEFRQATVFRPTRGTPRRLRVFKLSTTEDTED